MIKPSQIREKEFAKSTMGGYKTSDVNSFFDEVADSYEQLYKENSELLKKLRLLVENIEQYRKREQESEAAPDTSLSDARAEADKIIADARAQAQRIIADASNQSVSACDTQSSVDEIRQLREKEEKALTDIRAEVDRFRKSLLSMYTEHLTLIQSMMSVTSAAKQEVKEQTQEDTADEIQQGNPQVATESDIETDVAREAEDNSEEEMDAFFADAVSDEQSRMRQAFGGFRFEMGVETTDEVQLELEPPQEPERATEKEVAEETVVEESSVDEAIEKEAEPQAEADGLHSEAEAECETPEIIVLRDEPACEEAQEAPQESYQPSQEEVFYDMEIQDDSDDADDFEDSDDSDDSDDLDDSDDSEDDNEIEPSFKISFPVDDEAGNGEEENLDDLFDGFFNSFDKNR